MLREHLGIRAWVVAGVSWGVTLGLAYAQQHPERVLGMVLGAVTSGSRRETEWLTRDMGRLFPEQWEQFVSMVPEQERGGDLAAAYARLLASPDAHVRGEAARAWCAWEDTHVSLAPDWQPDPRYDAVAFRLVFARLVTHYWSHHSFLADRQLLAGMGRLENIPGVLIHGRYDISGPPDTAWQIHRAWPGSQLVLLNTGHGGHGFPEAFAEALGSLPEGRARRCRRGVPSTATVEARIWAARAGCVASVVGAVWWPPLVPDDPRRPTSGAALELGLVSALAVGSLPHNSRSSG